jgi:hypothetical protein
VRALFNRRARSAVIDLLDHEFASVFGGSRA